MLGWIEFINLRILNVFTSLFIYPFFLVFIGPQLFSGTLPGTENTVDKKMAKVTALWGSSGRRQVVNKQEVKMVIQTAKENVLT